ncbi:MAG TPA: PLP-dependent aminotransferase family protein [Alphaproteobacteria bacterium]|nr:PLP-dependent aminotransferase family protein [Alphaproteobacteria bacterium]
MTSWTPNLESQRGPRYIAIARALADDIVAGRLKSGERLPTHRDLAWKLGVTVGTVTRAYAEAERRGLIAGEVGRGTYVRERIGDGVLIPSPDPPTRDFIDLARNFPPDNPAARDIQDALTEFAKRNDLSPLLRYTTPGGDEAHRAVGAAWLAGFGLRVDPAQVVLTSGAQHAMLVAISGLARPGDVVLTEQLAFYGMKSIASMLSLRLQGVAMDHEGLLPDALEAACRSNSPKALYCVPTLQNPTTAIMSAERRAAIAEICRRHGVTIVEDDVYGFLVEDGPPPIATIAPDITVFVTSLSKCVAPGLRMGFAAAPRATVERLISGLRATTWMSTPLTTEIAMRHMADGSARRMAEWQRQEAIARQAIARRILGHADMATHPAAFHLWLKLPEPWRREEYAAQARRRGVGVAPADAFAVGRAPVPHAVRIGLSAARDRAQLERALGVLAEMLTGMPERDYAMV